MMDEGDRYYRYSVAWIDPMAKGRHLGRSVLTRGDHATVDQLPPRLAVDPLALRPRAAAHRAAASCRRPGVHQPRHDQGVQRAVVPQGAAAADRPDRVDPRLLPPARLVGSWNRLYGRHGFVQYQFVAPVRRRRPRCAR